MLCLIEWILNDGKGEGKKYERVTFLTVWYKTRSPEVCKFLELK